MNKIEGNQFELSKKEIEALQSEYVQGYIQGMKACILGLEDMIKNLSRSSEEK